MTIARRATALAFTTLASALLLVAAVGPAAPVSQVAVAGQIVA